MMEQLKSDLGGIPEPDFGSGESNRELATRWFREVWNERRTETIDELFAPGAIGHTENGDQGMAEFKVGREGLLNAFPAKHVVGAGVSGGEPAACRALGALGASLARSAADGDQVVVRWRARGTIALPASACSQRIARSSSAE